eukprot:CAMPEP_0181288742 /NCGR_PEP_ID=MMETSP1101-20121128/503_1 /TAXON_ID=46948 /ORGANISM="Rhodomonas abbreviata, Strain Caron Lab Isolate" /LENGTH=68 /DNA_ID=CAMNT_0023392901 /DNA_START=10 /DNA_END=213 /DNA_ORIENTATION=+
MTNRRVQAFDSSTHTNDPTQTGKGLSETICSEVEPPFQLEEAVSYRLAQMDKKEANTGIIGGSGSRWA